MNSLWLADSLLYLAIETQMSWGYRKERKCGTADMSVGNPTSTFSFLFHEFQFTIKNVSGINLFNVLSQLLL